MFMRVSLIFGVILVGYGGKTLHLFSGIWYYAEQWRNRPQKQPQKRERKWDVTLTANSGASLANVRSMTGHATTDMALHYFHENEDGLKRTIAMLPVIGGDAAASAKPMVGEFDAFLDDLDLSALKRLKKAIEARLGE